MKRRLTEQYIDEQLKFGLSLAIALDMLAKHENALNIVQATVAQLLIDLGYGQHEAYGAAVTLHVTGQDALINNSDVTASLPALVTCAAKIIRDRQIPGFIAEQVERTLA